MTDTIPTIEQAAEAIGLPVTQWYGRCMEIAEAIVESGLVEGRAVYGHWLGKPSTRSFFARCRHLPFQRHGWIKLTDGRLLDPTRWVFDATEPSLAIVTDPELYDEGGNQWRDELATPAPVYTPGDKLQFLGFESKEAADLALHLVGREVVVVQTPDDRWGFNLTVRQAHWLANLHYDLLGDWPAEIYQAIVWVGLGAFIPLDNRLRAEAAARAA